jgi:DNA-binding NarL/FixJ family response regulator
MTIGCAGGRPLARKLLDPLPAAVAEARRPGEEAGEMIRVALADDHAVVREGVRLMLELEPDLEVVAEAADGLEAVRVVQRLRPDVLILDLTMPGLGGIEVARRIARTAPQTRVVFLTGCSDEVRVRQAFGVGAAGYVVKGASCAELVEAVRSVYDGRPFLSSPFAEKGLVAYIGGSAGHREPCELLTEREIEVLYLAVQGLTARAIAERLEISPRTAEAHKGNLMRKLGLRCQTELVRFVIANGLVELNDC